LGRSRGGYGTKVHLRFDARGLPLSFVLTPGEDHEITAVAKLDALVDARPRCWLGDRAYDSDALRADLLLRGVLPVIPPRKSRKVPAPLDRDLYRERNKIERLVGRLKENRRLATRYEKTAGAFLGMLDLAAVRLWVEFVNKA